MSDYRIFYLSGVSQDAKINALIYAENNGIGIVDSFDDSPDAMVVGDYIEGV